MTTTTRVRSEPRPAGATPVAVGDGDGPRRDAPTSSPAPRRVRGVGLLAVLSLLATAGLGWLGYRGYEISKRIRGGNTIKSITDPTKPGYLAATVPTPVHLLEVTAGDDAPVDFVLMVEGPGGVGGSVVWIVGDLVVGEGDARATLVSRAGSGPAGAKRAIEELVGFGIADTTVVGPAEIAAMFEPVGKLAVENPDDLVARDGTKRRTAYAAGRLRLDPDEVGPYLTFLSDGAAPATRGTQAEAVWGAYFAAVRGLSPDTTSGSTSVSTDAGADLVAAALSMARDDVEFIVLPVNDEPFGPTRLYTPDVERSAQVLKGVVAAPVAAFPGQRPRVEVLNGSSDLDAAARVAPDVAAAGAEVTALGNAASFDHATTTVEYRSPEFAEAAASIAELFGVTATQGADQSEARDITVTLGADLR